MKSHALLCLIPTPLDDQSPIEPTALTLLKKTDSNTLILVEEKSVARKKWLAWGLAREQIDSFLEFNEHTEKDARPQVLQALAQGKTVYLMSDGGLPAFCDPGSELVRECHERGIPVTCTPFANSVALAVALSGIPCHRFLFEGFPPAKEPARAQFMKSLSNSSIPILLMDTPYRMESLLKEVSEHLPPGRMLFLACELGRKDEYLKLAPVRDLLPAVRSRFGKELKREFILIVAGKSDARP